MGVASGEEVVPDEGWEKSAARTGADEDHETQVWELHMHRPTDAGRHWSCC